MNNIIMIHNRHSMGELFFAFHVKCIMIHKIHCMNSQCIYYNSGFIISFDTSLVESIIIIIIIDDHISDYNIIIIIVPNTQ